MTSSSTCDEPPAESSGKSVNHLAEHGLGDDQFADHIDDAVDLSSSTRVVVGAAWQSAARARLRRFGVPPGAIGGRSSGADPAAQRRSRTGNGRAEQSYLLRIRPRLSTSAPRYSSSQSPRTNSNTSWICACAAAVRNVPFQPK